MRIGIMLRSLEEKGGVGVYTRYIVQELLAVDRQNEYYLYYATPNHLGQFPHSSRVVEKVLPVKNKFAWDQVEVPLACWRDHINILFHPKFTVPLLAPCKTVMVLHGAGWFMKDFSDFWNPADLRYIHTVMPWYLKKAAAVLSVSDITTQMFEATFHVRPGKIQTVYFGPGKQFRRVTDPADLERVRQKYGLPEKFILTLSGYDRGPRKNIAGILSAYARLFGRVPHHLVIGGRDCYKFKADYGIPGDGYGGAIHFTDWIDQEDLPAIYSLADLFLYPSFAEAFPIPITEAMACGTPIITSNLNGLVEIASEAALHVDPRDPQAIADAVEKVLCDPELSQALSTRGLARSQNFTWEKCAHRTLQILEAVGNKPERRHKTPRNHGAIPH